MVRTRKLPPGLLAALGIAVLLSACGDKSSPIEPVTPTPTPTRAAATPTPGMTPTVVFPTPTPAVPPTPTTPTRSGIG